MKRNLRSVVTGAVTLVATGGVLAATVGTAAASTPTWEPDPNALGTLAFYNSSGVQITGGSNTSHLFDFAVASSADPSTKKGTIANLAFANPQPSTPTGSFATSLDETSATPNSSAPNNIDSSGNPIVTLDSNGANLAAVQGGFTPNTQPGFVNVYQIRLYTTGAGGAGTTSNHYWDADVEVNSDGSWTEIYGTPVGTTTVLQTSGSPSVQGNSVTFTATETGADNSHPAGSVQFMNGASTLGSPQAVNASGVATLQTSALTASGSPYSITAVFTPTSSTYSASTSNTVTQTVTPPATPTTTTLGITGNTTTATDATLSGTVGPSGASGTVEFFDGGSSAPNPQTGTPLAVAGGPSVPVTSGSYSATLSGGFSAGPHRVVAVFTSSAPATYANSTSNEVDFNTVQGAAVGSTCSQPGSNCTDTQTIEGEIPTGTLVISTPYTDTSPLDVGKMGLSPDGTFWTGQATFQCITVTDSTSGGSPFVASAVANTLSQVPGTGNSAQNTSHAFTTINGENVGLTALAESTGACPDKSTPVESYVGLPGSVSTTQNPAATGVAPSDNGTQGLGNAPHTILTGTSGDDGTATYDGTLTLNAPTSTAAGTYKGTITFTVTD
jgi:hypothetical protein